MIKSIGVRSRNATDGRTDRHRPSFHNAPSVVRGEGLACLVGA